VHTRIGHESMPHPPMASSIRTRPVPKRNLAFRCRDGAVRPGPRFPTSPPHPDSAVPIRLFRPGRGAEHPTLSPQALSLPAPTPNGPDSWARGGRATDPEIDVGSPGVRAFCRLPRPSRLRPRKCESTVKPESIASLQLSFLSWPAPIDVRCRAASLGSVCNLAGVGASVESRIPGRSRSRSSVPMSGRFGASCYPWQHWIDRELEISAACSGRLFVSLAGHG